MIKLEILVTGKQYEGMTVMKELPKLCKEWELYMEIKPQSTFNGGRSTGGVVIHVSNGGYSGEAGTRTPFIYFLPNSLKMETKLAANNGGKWGHALTPDSPPSFVLGEWNTMTMKQYKEMFENLELQ